MPTDPLQLPLRDIHYPDGIAWWPPAPGWWLLLALFFMIAVLLWFGYRRSQAKKYAAITLARKELAQVRKRFAADGNAKDIVNELSVLLRRLSISTFPRRQAAGLTGDAWLAFLDQAMPDRPFSTGAGRMLMDAPYRPQVGREEVEPLLDLCDAWMHAVTAGRGAA